MVNGGRIGTYCCSGGNGITFHILSLKQSTFHPIQIQEEMYRPNNFGATHPIRLHDRTKAEASIIYKLAKIKIRSIDFVWLGMDGARVRAKCLRGQATTRGLRHFHLALGRGFDNSVIEV